MKVIFLDIDGVLNSTKSIRRNNKKYILFNAMMNSLKRRYNDNPDRKAIRYLNKIICETGAEVVLSSTWRLDASYHMIGRFLNCFGFAGNMIDSTPHIRSQLNITRGMEISIWLNEYQEKVGKPIPLRHKKFYEPITNFVILDDDSDMGESLMPFLVKTDNKIGLSYEDACKAIDILHTEMELKPVIKEIRRV